MHVFLYQTGDIQTLYYLLGKKVNLNSVEEVLDIFEQIENEYNDDLGYHELMPGQEVDLQPNSVIPDFAGL